MCLSNLREYFSQLVFDIHSTIKRSISLLQVIPTTHLSFEDVESVSALLSLTRHSVRFLSALFILFCAKLFFSLQISVFPVFVV